MNESRAPRCGAKPAPPHREPPPTTPTTNETSRNTKQPLNITNEIAAVLRVGFVYEHEKQLDDTHRLAIRRRLAREALHSFVRRLMVGRSPGIPPVPAHTQQEHRAAASRGYSFSLLTIAASPPHHLSFIERAAVLLHGKCRGRWTRGWNAARKCGCRYHDGAHSRRGTAIRPHYDVRVVG